jgi:hypothetical protein
LKPSSALSSNAGTRRAGCGSIPETAAVMTVKNLNSQRHQQASERPAACCIEAARMHGSKKPDTKFLQSNGFKAQTSKVYALGRAAIKRTRALRVNKNPN